MKGLEQVRSFNRTGTRGIGVLNTSFLGGGVPLGQARTLCENGRDGIRVGDLGARLNLDSGYASRLLRSLERVGLVATVA